jgi:hypothetical protein
MPPPSHAPLYLGCRNSGKAVEEEWISAPHNFANFFTFQPVGPLAER